MSADCIPGRSALLITSYLILTNIATNSNYFDSPTFTAMDVWFNTCRVMVGGAIFEFLLLLRKGKKPANTMLNIGTMLVPIENNIDDRTEEQCAKYDHYSFIFFNAVFIAFCVVYMLLCFSLR